MGDRLHIQQKAFSKFNLPYDIKASDLKLVESQVNSAAITEEMQTLIVEGLSKSSNFKSA